MKEAKSDGCMSSNIAMLLAERSVSAAQFNCSGASHQRIALLMWTNGQVTDARLRRVQSKSQDVLSRVLRMWAFQTQPQPNKMTREGQPWAHSDTFGLMRTQHRKVLGRGISI